MEAGQIADTPTVSGRSLFEEAREAVEAPRPTGRRATSPPRHGARLLRRDLRRHRAGGRGDQTGRPRHRTLRRPRARVRRRGSRLRRGAGRRHRAKATSSSSATKAPSGGPGMREMLQVTARSEGPRHAERRADHRRPLLRRRPTASSPATFRRKRRAAARSRCSATATPSRIDVADAQHRRQRRLSSGRRAAAASPGPRPSALRQIRRPGRFGVAGRRHHSQPTAGANARRRRRREAS